MSEKTERSLTQLFLVVLVAATYGVALFEQFFQKVFPYEPPPVLAQDYAAIHSLPCYPLSSHPMFCWDFHRPTIYSLELEGRLNGKWTPIKVDKELSPLWEKGLRESLHTHLRRGGDVETFALLLVDKLKVYDSLRLHIERWQWEEWLGYRQSRQNSYEKTSFRPYARDLLVEVKS